MARVGDPGFLLRLTEILESRDPMDLPIEVDNKLGVTVSIPADLLLRKARRRAVPTGTILRKEVTVAAGVEWEFVVAAGKVWRPIALHAQLVTSATVATRAALLFIHPNDTTKPIYRDAIPSGTGQAASLTWDYSWALNTQIMQEVGNGKLVRPMPGDLYLPGDQGWRIRSNTLNLQVGDQWGRVHLLIDEFDYVS